MLNKPRPSRLAAVVAAGLMLAVTVGGTANAAGAAKPLKGTAAVVTSGGSSCALQVTYTWSGFVAPQDHVDIYVQLWLHDLGHTDVLVDFNTGGDIGNGSARSGTFAFTFHPVSGGGNPFVGTTGAGRIYGKGLLIGRVHGGTAVVAGSEAVSAAITLPMSCRGQCDYLANQGCVVLGNIVLREATVNLNTDPPTVTYISDTTFTIGGNLTISPTCPNDPDLYPTCTGWSNISITGSGSFSVSNGTSGTWTASYSYPGPYSFSGGLAPSCQSSAIRTITATLTLTFGSGGTAVDYLEIRTDSTATGETKNFVELTNSTGGLPTGGSARAT